MRIYLVAPQSNAHQEYSRLASGREGGEFVTRIASTAIATVAALAPSGFDIELCDEAVQTIDFETAAEVVGITANVSQAQRALNLADRFRALGKTVVLGGPHVSLAPVLFEGRADCLVVGEFEMIAEEFFRDLASGALKARYNGPKADLARSPPPRWDLYPNERALSGVVQTSRGCPFECHFCDVIAYLGRVQRHKSNDQVIAEIQALYDHGYDFIALADDNFTVYRKRARALLSDIARWNGKEGRDYVVFTTQMSIDVARDPELLALCNDAGLLNTFIGLETSDEGSLLESRKRQNLRVDLVEECRKVVRAGIRVEAGLIVGFDHDDHGAFRRQLEFAMALPVGTFNLSVLVAPVATPLYESMRAANRIVLDDPMAQFPSANLITNFKPAQMSRDDLYVGAKWLVNHSFDPDNFFARLSSMAELLAAPPWQRHGGRRRQRPSKRRALGAFAHVMRDLTRRDPRVAAVVRKSHALMRRHPEIRDGIGEVLGHYLMTLRSYEMDGIYERGWSDLKAPPFGSASSDTRLERIRAHA